MKITEVRLYPVSYPAPHVLRWGFGEHHSMGGTLLHVFTDEGLVGLGDAGGRAGGPLRTQRAHLEEALLPLLIGQNPLDVERLWEQMAARAQGRLMAELIGGIDVALWDIVGKAAGLPLFRVFGAYRDAVPLYSAPSLRRPDELLAELQAHRDRGFTATKLRLGLGPVGWAGHARDQSEDLAVLRGARKLLGPSFAIGADTDKTYDHAMAARLAPVVHEVDLAWLEEPLREPEREHYVREFLRLREVVRVPLAGGQGFFGVHQFDALLHAGVAGTTRAVDILQPDVATAGGLTPIRKVAAMAQGCGVAFMPHVSCHSGYDVRVVAAAHVLAAAPNGRWLCYPAYDTPLRTELLREPPDVRDGLLHLSDRPGLGIDLDLNAAARLGH